jgi:hypothetical protein
MQLPWIYSPSILVRVAADHVVPGTQHVPFLYQEGGLLQ